MNPFDLSGRVAAVAGAGANTGIGQALMLTFQGGAAVFLASPASDYVDGHALAVDGGRLAR